MAELLDPTAGPTDDNPDTAPSITAETAPVTEQVVDTVSPIYETVSPIYETDVANEIDQEMPPENQPNSTAQPAEQVAETPVAKIPVTETQSPIRLQPADSNPTFDLRKALLATLPERAPPAPQKPPVVVKPSTTVDETPTVVAETPAAEEAAEQAAPQIAQLTIPEETLVEAAEQTRVEGPTPSREQSLDETLAETPEERLVEAPKETFVEVPARSSENLLVEAPVEALNKASEGEAGPVLPSHTEDLAGIEQQVVSQEQLALEIALEAELESKPSVEQGREALQKQQIALEERIAAAGAIMAAERAEQAHVEVAQQEAIEREAPQEDAIQNETLQGDTPAENFLAQEEFSNSETTTENLPVEHPGEQDVPIADQGPPQLPAAITTEAGEEHERYAMEPQLSRPSRTKGVGQPVADLIAPPMALINPAEPGPHDQESASSQSSAPALEDEQLLLSHQEPAIISRVEGPRRIQVGSEANYCVTLQNNGGTAVQALESQIRVPAWAELVGVTASRGTVQRIEQSDNSVIVLWQLQDMQAHGSQTLQLKLIPKDGRALQLGVQWSHAPGRAEAVVEVQEPRLQMDLSGPNEAIYGKPVRYRLTLSNPGSAPAENVAVLLVPFGDLEKSITDHSFGQLLPGERKEVQLELVAREPGELVMRAKAIAEGGLEAEAVKMVTCLKPELLLDWRGPQTKYAGTPATYYFRVYNPGSAPTDSLEVNLQLPTGVDFLAASEGFSRDSRRGAITWRLTGLKPKEERFLQVRCNLDRPGDNELLISAQTARSNLRKTKTIRTHVMAVADLKLDVSDPQGPLPVGESADYLIRVRNRGNSAARGINVVALFSEGIDPTAAEGARYTMRDGRVAFQTIDSLQAGSEVVLQIRAEASQPGTHIFRTEVYCQDLDIKLSAEETTRFFLDENRWDGQNSPQSAGRDTAVWR